MDFTILFSEANDDTDEWLEAHAIEQWIEAGAPPVGDTSAQPAAKSEKPPAPRLAVNLDDAAEALSLSDDFFRAHVKPELKIVRRGRRQFVAIRELERWLEESAARTL